MEDAKPMQIARSLGQWARKNISAATDFDTVPQSREAHTLAISGTVGLAAGAIAGTVLGVKNLERVDTLEATPISDPIFEGYKYMRWEETSEHCSPIDPDYCWESTDGYHHIYPPEYTERIVGEYELPTFSTPKRAAPVAFGLAGAMAGGVLGLVTGVGINLLRQQMNPDLPPAQIPRRKDWDLTDSNLKITEYTFLSGAVGGAALGALIGNKEMTDTAPAVRTYTGPVTVKTEMGLVPEKSFSVNYDNRADAPATVSVYRDLPQYGENGEVLMELKTEEFQNARFGPWMGALYGGMAGAVAGVATGVAVSYARRMMSYEESGLLEAVENGLDEMDERTQ